MTKTEVKKIPKTQVKKDLLLFKSLHKLPTESLKHILQHMDDESVDKICECVYNVLKTKIKFSSKKRKQLVKNIHEHCCLKNLKTIENRKVSVSKRRKALVQEGKGIGLILSAIVPLLTRLFMKQ
jgi:CHAD domain-containing protein